MSEETQSTDAAPAGAERGARQVRVGRVTSAKMDKTVVVAVAKPVMHRLYKSRMTKSTKFVAHDAENTCREGDLVSLVATRPLSKTKRWRVQSVLQRAEG